jgi:cell wall-associated NlpC family hydrolase
MTDLTKYLDGIWVEGGRSWPEIDCYGLVLEVRRGMGLPEWPEWGEARQGDSMQAAGDELTRERERCQPEPGAVAMCYRGSMLTHVAVVVEADGVLQVLECNSGSNVRLTPLPRFCRRFVRVEFYR